MWKLTRVAWGGAETRSMQEIIAMLQMESVNWIRSKYVLPLLGSELKYTQPDRPKSRTQKYVATSKTYES